MLNATQRRSEKDGALDPEACLDEVDRLVRSPHLSGSEALCKLLHFLAHHALDSPTEHIKEYEIATQVFGRPPDFDPQADSGVRVQMARLRTKLAEYYLSDGASDAIQVEVPKGGYSLSFRRRIIETDAPAPGKEVRKPTAQPESIPIRRSRAIMVVALLWALTIAGSIAYIAFRRPRSIDRLNNQAAQAVSPVLRTFWGPFLLGSEPPFVVFSNAEFVGNPITGMRYYNRTRDSGNSISEHYTGIGEVMGVEELEGLFLHFGRQFQIKRGGLFTLDDARTNNLIFVGSPTENLTLGEIPENSGFAFKQIQVGQDWTQAVIDLRPRPGESANYLPTPETQPMQVDYAVITLAHGLDRSRWTLILAGASTVGTQAAVDFACDPDSVKDILRRLEISPGSDMKPFEALLRVKVANDVPLTSELVKLRRTE